MWRKILIGVAIVALPACGQPGGQPDVSSPASTNLSAAAALPASSLSPADYVAQTVQVITTAAAGGNAQPLQDFLTFCGENDDLDKAVKQQIASTLLNQLGSMRLGAAQQTTFGQQLQTIAAGNFVVAARAPGPRPFVFPQDDGAHRDLSEWWYYTGHLQTADGRRYGYEVTFFRVLPVIFFAHVAVTDEQTGHFAYARNFFSPSQASVASDHLEAHYQDWSVKAMGPQAYQLSASVENFSFTLNLQSQRPQPLLINGDGYIPMDANSFTYYYSLTRMNVTGQLQVDGQSLPIQGVSWMDHQWGNFAPGWPVTVTGWNWFSVQLADGTEYNMFQMLPWQGDPSPLAEVNVYRPDGTTAVYKDLQLSPLRVWESPVTGKGYVVDWQLTVPDTGETLRITADQDDQELARRVVLDVAPNYWEGSSHVTRTAADGSTTAGVGYTEETRVANQPS